MTEKPFSDILGLMTAAQERQQEQDTMEQRIRLLIADDAPRSRDGLRALLATIRLGAYGELLQGPQSGVGPQVEVVGEAANGQEAVRLLGERRPDVVLMDARMPVMDGLEATRVIKDKWPEVKIIVLTMYPAYRAQALAAGADVCLIKGCPPEDLLKAILSQ
jgi:DNA-binding NarL/FixJ family response regulator